MKIMHVTNKRREKNCDWYGMTLFYPVNDADVKLFLHCTGGHVAVTKAFLDMYLPVFENHGIKVEIEEAA